MQKSLEIYIRNTDTRTTAPGGATLAEVWRDMPGAHPDLKPICALVNNKCEALHYALYAPKQIEYLSTQSATGYRVYIHSLCMLLARATADMQPGKRLMLAHSVAGGYYCTLPELKRAPTAEEVTAIRERMHQLVAQDLPFVPHEEPTDAVARRLSEAHRPDVAALLRSQGNLYTRYYTLDGYPDTFHAPLAPSTGYIQVFDLQPYKEGMLLLGPDHTDVTKVNKPIAQEKMFRAFTEYTDFNSVIGIESISMLNQTIATRQAGQMINVAEALHNRMFADIAHRIARRNREGGARIILIAGPSSSGKTTSAKRLQIQLLTNYLVPKVISLDNYFVDRNATPRDEAGEYDYESLYALDLDTLNTDLNDLLKGKTVKMPTFNFEKGQREYRGDTMQLQANEILVLEGIHGLNPDLTAGIPDESKFRLYVSALTTLNIDDHNWISTTDNRLLRRIVRDSRYRGVTAEDTLARWASVRRGEDRWIFPFQENADAMFNSSLLFELAALRPFALPILEQVPNHSPYYSEAYRLRKLLQLLRPLPLKDVPPTSLLREFLGGSSFHY